MRARLGAVCLSESLANKALVAGELATNAMGLSGVLAQARDAVLLVRLEVALEPIPVTRIFIRALPRQDMRGDAVEEHAVVADDHGATGELKQRGLQGGQGLDVQVVGRLVQKQQVATLLEGEGEVQAVALATRENTGALLLVGTLEAEAGNVGAAGHLALANLHDVQTVGDNLPQVLIGIDARAVLVDVGDLYGLTDLQVAAG